MGRKERRLIERKNRIDNKKNAVQMQRNEMREFANEVRRVNVEDLMTCFALAEHRLYGFGKKRILRTLTYVDELMGPIISGECTLDDYKKIIEEEAHIQIVCE